MRGAALPYLGARACALCVVVARRHDESWDEPGVVVRPLVLSGASTQEGGDKRLTGASRQHQLRRDEARTVHTSQAASASSVAVDGYRRPRLVAELAEGVVTAPGELARRYPLAGLATCDSCGKRLQGGMVRATPSTAVTGPTITPCP